MLGNEPAEEGHSITIKMGENFTTVTYTMPYRVKDQNEQSETLGEIVGHCAVRRIITIANEDLAEDWSSGSVGQSLRCSDQLFPCEPDLASIKQKLAGS